jgi:hypothetical protein
METPISSATPPLSQLEILLGRRRVMVQPMPLEMPGVETVIAPPEEIIVKQFTGEQYDTALPLVDDERGLVALACGRTKKELAALTPESYELLQAAVWEVNAKGFFPFAQRQIDHWIKSLANLPQHLAKLEIERLTSLARSPVSRPQRT